MFKTFPGYKRIKFKLFSVVNRTVWFLSHSLPQSICQSHQTTCAGILYFTLPRFCYSLWLECSPLLYPAIHSLGKYFLIFYNSTQLKHHLYGILFWKPHYHWPQAKLILPTLYPYWAHTVLQPFLILTSLNCIYLFTRPLPRLDCMLLEDKDYVSFLSASLVTSRMSGT